MLNVSSLSGATRSSSDSLRYGKGQNGDSIPASAAERRPVVVWNVTRSCNLACRHCYASAKPGPDPEELTTSEALEVIESLARYRVPALLLSGGEPTARPDFFDLLRAASAAGLSVTISTNGTLIDADLAETIAEAKVTYVGVSIDGPPALHDRLRCVRGAWECSVKALQELGNAGVKRGVRFTLAPATYEGLPAVLDLIKELKVERFCMYHLVPAGRGVRLADVSPAQRLAALRMVFDFAGSAPGTEVLTVANPSDAVALYLWLKERDPELASSAWRSMAWNGGARNASGVGLACIDEKGTVFPDQFSRHKPIGSLREAPFDDIWNAWRTSAEGRRRRNQIPRKCKDCAYLEICGGGMRVRAELATGDPAGFDPSCILDELEGSAA